MLFASVTVEPTHGSTEPHAALAERRTYAVKAADKAALFVAARQRFRRETGRRGTVERVHFRTE